ncbi:MAG: hypothetical protein EOO15_08285 [Chitinophagaceae bacterium]|nr:MAG: hypothetical protein EOO15_08285 [Chitinophagaceae bacterium]
MTGFFQEYRNSKKVVAQEYDFIFYSESAYYHQYFRSIWDALAAQKKFRLCYITSDAKDPMLQTAAEGTDVYFLKATLMFVFQRLRAKAMILTMPNLELHGYKRSPWVGKYVYVFHALVSSHQQYHEQAFDHYDAVFCCGSYHAEEIRAAEALRGLRAKELVPFGYPLLGELRQAQAASEPTILLAPSWHPEGILSTCLEPVLLQLQQLSLPVQIRPHPEFRKREPKKMKALEALVRRSARLQIDTTPDLYAQLAAAQLLVTDRSGIALEYAFARRKPVLFVDTPSKIYNRNYTALGIEPIEDRLRSSLGSRVDPQSASAIAGEAKALLEQASGWNEKMAALEAATVYDSSHWMRGIAYLEGLVS